MGGGDVSVVRADVQTLLREALLSRRVFSSPPGVPEPPYTPFDLQSMLLPLLPPGSRAMAGFPINPKVAMATKCETLRLRFSERLLMGRPAAEADALFGEVRANACIGALRRLIARVEKAAGAPFVVFSAVAFPLAPSFGGSPYVRAYELVAVYWMRADDPAMKAAREWGATA